MRHVPNGLDRRVNRLIKPVTRLIKENATRCLNQGKELCKMVKHHEELLDIIARQVARQHKREE